MTAGPKRGRPGTPGGPGGPGLLALRRSLAALVCALSLALAGTLLLAPPAGAAARPPAPDSSPWYGTWGTAPAPAAPDGISQEGLEDRTVRMVVHTSVGGDELRLRLSNAYGTGPLDIGRATVARSRPGSPGAVEPGSVRRVTFGGAAGTTVAAGAGTLTDPVGFDVPADADLVVSLYLPRATGPATWHWLAQQTSYVSEPGDHAAEEGAAAFTRTETSWFFLTGVDVRGPGLRGTVVALGDSQTDGVGSTPDGSARWTDALARRLAADPATRGTGVLNKGIGGNRVLRDGTETDRPQRGTSAVGRLERDVLRQSGVRTAVLYEGINDLQLEPRASAQEVLDGLRGMARRLHERGIRVVVATLTPFEGSPLWSPEAERGRAEVNAALRASTEFDAVVDFDAAVRDPADPSRVRPEYDAGDHIHLNDAGYRALAAAVPTDALTGEPAGQPTGEPAGQPTGELVPGPERRLS
ncbi:GDSL-type esterase/lipase family protein [Streptomyces sp. B-S-A8]|uniref:GDSL-type esterase/lipase family protein n=1 Tax=Streptomyces solicavernae TaxID=3043614 RepID=A0ABT6RZH8_9ACTN|nr:GDSL-type esterase/lipase family protein [Streptomyces sp. B-S-A8]MDI3389574.1 GDSL-type esterase/lipase family protein [Streptomyces sp. B-S-A8]